MSQIIHVAAAVIRDQQGKILITKRPDDKHQGGKWEFPGGKREAGESIEAALKRELYEELDIELIKADPLIKIQYNYPEYSVLLDVWQVHDFSGKAYGKEGQEINWIELAELQDYQFPEANLPILTAIQLPDICLITPEPRYETNFLASLETALKQGIRLVQFRAKELSNADYMDLARQSIRLVHQYGGKIILNSPPLWIKDADGMHLSSEILQHTPYRPSIGKGKIITAACHTQTELDKAAYIQVDAVFISPVKPTTSHPKAEAISWQGFQKLADNINVPAYALGGLDKNDLKTAKLHYAQGIAAISSIWEAVS